MNQNETNNGAPQWVQDELAELSRPIRDLILKYGGNKADSFVVMFNTQSAGIYEAKPGVDVENLDAKKKFLDEFLADMPNRKGGLFKDILKDVFADMLDPKKEPTKEQVQWVRDNAAFVHKTYSLAGGKHTLDDIIRDAKIVAGLICEPCDCGKRNCDVTMLFNRMTADLLAGQNPAG